MLKVLAIEEAYRRIKSGSILLIDVRTEMEYKTLRIKGSVNIPLDRLQVEIVNMVSNKEENIMLYCATGSRVRRAAQILWSLGYSNIYIWEGAGINTFAFHDLIVYNRGEQDE
jgi:rhodanese-related sulfurtransferase